VLIGWRLHQPILYDIKIGATIKEAYGMETQNERITMIRNDREHGSRWLVRETISVLYDIATQPTSSPEENVQQLQRVGNELANARPAMAALSGAVRRILNAQGGLEGMVREAAKLLNE